MSAPDPADEVAELRKTARRALELLSEPPDGGGRRDDAAVHELELLALRLARGVLELVC